MRADKAQERYCQDDPRGHTGRVVPEGSALLSSVTIEPGVALQPRHPITGRWLAYDCEIDCLQHCAGLCGNWQ